MKKYSLIALLAVSVMLSSVAYAGIAAPEFDGTIKSNRGGRPSTPVRVYKLVRNSSRGASTGVATQGAVVVYDTVSDDGVTVRMTATSRDGAIAGIAVTTLQTSDATGGTSALDDEGLRNWGWIQVHGPAVATLFTGGSNTASIGDAAYASTDQGAMTSWPDGGYATGTSSAHADIANAGRIGIFLDAPAATDVTADVFIQLE